MSYVTGTTHYNLPQTVGTDKRDWADTNQAFADIDAAIYGAVEDVATAGTDISGIKDRLDTAEGNITQLQTDVGGLDTRLTTAEGSITTQAGQISDVRADVEDMICAYNEPTATSTHAYSVGDYFIYNDVLYRATQSIAISDTIVPDTNCTTTNISVEMLVTQNSIAFSDYGSVAHSAHLNGSYFYLDGALSKAIIDIAIGDTYAENVNFIHLQVGSELAELWKDKADKNIVYAQAFGNGVKTVSDLILELENHISDADFDKYVFTLNLGNEFFLQETYHNTAEKRIEFSYSNSYMDSNNIYHSFTRGMGVNIISGNRVGYSIIFNNDSTDGTTVVSSFTNQNANVVPLNYLYELLAQPIPINV